MSINLIARIGVSLQSMGSLLKRTPPTQGVSASTADDDSPEKRASRERKSVRRMKADLYEMLQAHPAARKTVRHLAVLERTLIRRGFEGVTQLPEKVLVRALAELEFLVRDWSRAGLAELRSRLAVLVKNLAQEMSAGPTSTGDLSAPNSMPDAIDLNDVTEVEHELFEELERSWTGQMPLSAPELPAGAQAQVSGRFS
jgi:hypothetical protein